MKVRSYRDGCFVNVLVASPFVSGFLSNRASQSMTGWASVGSLNVAPVIQQQFTSYDDCSFAVGGMMIAPQPVAATLPAHKIRMVSSCYA